MTKYEDRFRQLSGLAHEELRFEELYTLLEQFRQKEGFLQVELVEIAESFQRFVPGGGAITGPHLSAAIRWMGFPVTLEQVQDICNENEYDGNEIGLAEFVRLIARYRELEIRHIRRSFARAHEEDVVPAKLQVLALRKILLACGFAPAQGCVTELMQEVGGESQKLTLWEFADLVTKYRHKIRDRIRINYGFTDIEVRKHHTRFRRFDRDGAGVITNKNLADLIRELFPDVSTDLATHTQAKEVFRQVDMNGDGKLDWDEYLQMMRGLQDREDAQKLHKEFDAINESRFTSFEVKEFRKIFNIFDGDGSGDLDVTELEEMLEGIVRLQGPRLRELAGLLREVDSDYNRVLDFPEFLRFMHKIQDSNWADINTRSAKIASTCTKVIVEKTVSSDSLPSPLGRDTSQMLLRSMTLVDV